jgi:hypothetical protein
MEDVLIPLAPFIMVVLIVLTVFYFNSKNKRAILETVREASRNGQTLDAETIKALGMPSKKSQGGDLKAGAVLIAIALAILVLGLSIGGIDDADAAEAVPVMAAIAAFPGFIGVVLLLFGLAGAASRKKARELD